MSAEQNNDPPRHVLLKKPIEFPSTKVDVQVIRILIPKGYKSPLHTHESPGPRYVVRGRLKIEERGDVHEYGPGDVFWESGQWLTVENIANEETEIIVLELPKAR
jgi:quercetin dioxygenase-like cupin family protein